jgi:hypothetical protein
MDILSSKAYHGAAGCDFAVSFYLHQQMTAYLTS